MKWFFFIFGFSLLTVVFAADKLNFYKLPANEKRILGNDARSKLAKSVFLLKSSAGSGSGFLTLLDGKPVLVTNAHVFAGMKNITIYDINGNQYAFRRIQISQKRDIVILHLSTPIPDSIKPLPVHSSVDTLPLDVRVAAYGDSLGDGVITSLSGTLLGIGPEVIEVNAPFVPGNSGGPVIDLNSGSVIGVATYLRYLTPRNATTGSRFESKLFQVAVRRFATRIDNIAPFDLPSISLERLELDQDNYAKIESVSDLIYKLIKQYDGTNARTIVRLIQELCARESANIAEIADYKWKTVYFSKQFQEKYENLKHIFDVFDLDDIILKRSLEKVWTDNMSASRQETIPAVTEQCKRCSGRGYTRVNENAGKVQLASWVKVSCDSCDGKGEFVIKKQEIHYQLPASSMEKIAKLIKADPKEFCGFVAGGKCPHEISKFEFYGRDAFLGVLKNPFGMDYRFKGNHQLENAEETRFTRMMNRLVKVTIILPLKDEQMLNDLVKYADENYGIQKHFKVNLRLLTKKTDSTGKSLSDDGSPKRGLLSRNLRSGSGSGLASFGGSSGTDIFESRVRVRSSRSYGGRKSISDPFKTFFNADSVQTATHVAIVCVHETYPLLLDLKFSEVKSRMAF